MSSPAQSSKKYFWLIIGVLVIIILIAFAYINFVFAEQYSVGATFQIYWTSTREFILTGESPYSEGVTLKNQMAVYGRPALVGEDEQRFTYPLFSTFLFTPYAIIADFNTARVLWMTSLQVSLIALAFISMKLTGWQPGLLLLSFLLVFSMLWYHGFYAVFIGDVVVLTTLLIGLALIAVKTGKDELAGILLALATINPQVVLLLIIFIFIWAASHHRWAIIFWFLVGLVFLSLAGLAFIPDWPLQYLRTILRQIEYRGFDTPGTILSQWMPGIGARLGWGLTIVMVALLLIEWVAARRKGFRWFFWAACLTLVASQWIGLPTNPANFILSFIPMILVLATLVKTWGKRGLTTATFMLLLAFIGLWAVYFLTGDFDLDMKQNNFMFFPLPAMLLIGLYWVRWRAIRPDRLMADILRLYESN